MTQSENNSEPYNRNSDWYYFDIVFGDNNRFASDYSYTYIPDIAQPNLSISKIVSMTKFDSSGTAERLFYILEEK